jgi:hypothetical protein
MEDLKIISKVVKPTPRKIGLEGSLLLSESKGQGRRGQIIWNHLFQFDECRTMAKRHYQ